MGLAAHGFRVFHLCLALMVVSSLAAIQEKDRPSEQAPARVGLEVLSALSELAWALVGFVVQQAIASSPDLPSPCQLQRWMRTRKMLATREQSIAHESYECWALRVPYVGLQADDSPMGSLV